MMKQFFERINKGQAQTLGLCLCAVVSLLLTSCLNEEEGEFTLTGNIGHLIPAKSYKMEVMATGEKGDTHYLGAVPELDESFATWGLSIKKVVYTLDGKPLKTITGEPFDLVAPVNNPGTGTHSLETEITVGGKNCEDAVLKKTASFTFPSPQQNTTPQIYVDYNYVSKGGTLRMTPHVLADYSPEGCRFTKVEYFWDEELMATLTASPFTWTHPVNDDAGSKHQIKVVIEYEDNNHKKGGYNFNVLDYSALADDGAICDWWLKTRDNEYLRSETLHMVARLYKGSERNEKFSFEQYLDDKVIGSSSTFPYNLDYPLSGVAAGLHTLKAKWTHTTADGLKYSMLTSRRIFVLP